MEIKITTQQVLKVLQVLSWIIFIGLCVEAGSILFSTIYTIFINPANNFRFWDGADLSNLYKFDSGYFLAIVLTMFIISVLKAIMFYLIVKLFVDRKLNLSQPFSPELRQFILNISYLALGIGLFSYFGCEYAAWLMQQGVKMPDPKSLHLEGADIWFFMSVILFVIVQIVKRGIEIQSENELTV